MLTHLVRAAKPVAVAATCLLLLVGVVGCTDGDPSSREPAESVSEPTESSSTGSAATLEAKPVPLKVRVTKVRGSRFDQAQRTSLKAKVGRAVSRYINAGLFGGDYPREKFDEAFSSFTRGAAREARGQRDLLTNADIGGSVESITPRRRTAELSVLAPNEVAAGVTARIHLVYIANREKRPDIRVRMTGRLLLTRAGPGGWKIFGYDVARSADRLGKGGRR